jgi:hypothetical protein
MLASKSRVKDRFKIFLSADDFIPRKPKGVL